MYERMKKIPFSITKKNRVLRRIFCPKEDEVTGG
jgi:hypothetical protein